MVAKFVTLLHGITSAMQCIQSGQPPDQKQQRMITLLPGTQNASLARSPAEQSEAKAGSQCVPAEYLRLSDWIWPRIRDNPQVEEVLFETLDMQQVTHVAEFLHMCKGVPIPMPATPLRAATMQKLDFSTEHIGFLTKLDPFKQRSPVYALLQAFNEIDCPNGRDFCCCYIATWIRDKPMEHILHHIVPVDININANPSGNAVAL